MKLRRVFSKAIDRDGPGLRLRAALHAVVAANVDESTRRQSVTNDYKPLSREELSQLAGEELPERAAMSLVNANVAIPINAAIAANVLSDGAIAYADAAQTTPIDQSNL
jgi:hypothetical protein